MRPIATPAAPLCAALVRAAACGALLLSVCCSSGCTVGGAIHDYWAYNDNTNDFVMGWRNSVWAREAWHAEKAQYAGHPQFRAFGEGFRAGYIAVASGGNGCPPALPPRWYWSWRYQNPEGQAQVAAWYEGFPYGARAADVDGAGLYQQIQVSAPMQRQYSPEFLDPSLPPQSPTPATGPPTSAPGPLLENITTPPGQPFLGPPTDALGATGLPPTSVVVPANVHLPLPSGPAAVVPLPPGPGPSPPAPNGPTQIAPTPSAPPTMNMDPRTSSGAAGFPPPYLPPPGPRQVTANEWFRLTPSAADSLEPTSGQPNLLCLLPQAARWPGQ